MKLVYISDFHHLLGPREPIRPEMRRLLHPLGRCGRFFMDRVENRLRYETGIVHNAAFKWLKNNDSHYDLIVNGGDNAMPLSKHDDRIQAVKSVWKRELKRYGEEKYIALSGNHELGHGYEPDPDSFEGLLDLRWDLFSREVNRLGYGYERIEGCTLLTLDSELAHFSMTATNHPKTAEHAEKMLRTFEQACREPGPMIVITHNTRHVRRWILGNERWPALRHSERQVIMLGGHFHIPRRMFRKGVDVLWSGGASYPEPWMRWAAKLPLFGFLLHGPGAIEAYLESGKIAAAHQPFGLDISLWPLTS